MSLVYRAILVLNMMLVLLLIFLAYREKKILTGERAREMISSNWNLFKLAVALGLLALLVFLVYEILEFIAFVFRAEVLQIAQIEDVVKMGIALFVFFVSLVNLYIVLRIREKGAEVA